MTNPGLSNSSSDGTSDLSLVGNGALPSQEHAIVLAGAGGHTHASSNNAYIFSEAEFEAPTFYAASFVANYRKISSLGSPMLNKTTYLIIHLYNLIIL